MLQLNKLPSLVKKRKRVGRGGKRGQHSGRGNDGQKCRSGGKSEIKPYFEGGQMPLVRRLPCRGFKNPFREEVVALSLNDLEKKYNAGDVVNSSTLREKRLLKGRKKAVKILGTGSLSKNLTVSVDYCSVSARDAIKQAGGSVNLVREIESDSSVS